MLFYDIPIEKVPPYMVTKNVLRGYRVGGTYKECLKSLFRWHNETLNAWTMIVVAIFVLASSCWTIQEYDLDFSHSLPFILFVVGYWVHLPFSVGYHLFMPINTEVNSLWRKMDVYGIFIRGTCLTLATSYFVLSFWGTVLNTFLSLVTTIWGIRTFSKVSIYKPLNKLQQALFVSVSIFFYYFPFYLSFVQDYVDFGWQSFSLTNSFWIFLGMTLTVASGGACYAFGIPERFSPGTFDIFFNSHIVLHLGVIVASGFEFWFLLDNMIQNKFL